MQEGPQAAPAPVPRDTQLTLHHINYIIWCVCVCEARRDAQVVSGDSRRPRRRSARQPILGTSVLPRPGPAFHGAMLPVPGLFLIVNTGYSCSLLVLRHRVLEGCVGSLGWLVPGGCPNAPAAPTVVSTGCQGWAGPRRAGLPWAPHVRIIKGCSASGCCVWGGGCVRE